MVFITRVQALIGISMMTGLLCLQDYLKKSIILTNFTQSLFNREKLGETREDMMGKEKIVNAVENSKHRYEIVKQAVKEKAEELKDKGEGSIYKGLKQACRQKKENIKKGKPKFEKQNEEFEKLMVQNLEPEQINGGKTYPQIISQKLTKGKQNMLVAKEAAATSYRKTADLYNKTSESKSQKLIQKHLTFGGLSLFGSLLMPQTYVLLAFGYFVAYQMYFFSGNLSKIEKYKWLQNQQFTPIWYGFIAVGSLILLGKSLKIMRNFAK